MNIHCIRPFGGQSFPPHAYNLCGADIDDDGILPDCLLTVLSLDPALTQKRLGDGFYEQRLITEQIAQLTGRRFLDGYENDEAQYRALMNAGVTFAQEHQLIPGVALSAEQVAQLTSDIVWLVAQDVTLADGSTQQVLVPQVYVRVRDGDLSPSGALIAANDLRLETQGDLVTGGALAGRNIVALTAENLTNERGRIVGQDVNVQAQNDIALLGGTMEAGNSLVASAGRDLAIESSASAQHSQRQGSATFVDKTVIDRVAGLYVTGEGGALIAAAGRDFSLNAAAVQNSGEGGATVLQAGRDLTLGTVTETLDSFAQTKTSWKKEAAATQVGSVIQSQGDILIQAGNDLTAKGATVASQEGALIAQAGGDITLATATNTYRRHPGHKRHAVWPPLRNWKAAGQADRGVCRPARDTWSATGAIVVSSPFAMANYLPLEVWNAISVLLNAAR